MDDTMKKYEHRHLAMSVCEHKCNVSEKYVLPQAQAFGLSWSMATAGLADIHNNSCWGRTAMRKMKCVAERISGGGPPWAHEAGGVPRGVGSALHPRGQVAASPAVIFAQ